MSAFNLTEFNLDEYPLWTALITPFFDDGSVDYQSLDKILDLQVAANVGLLILGSTGEALNLKLQTRKEIINHCCARQLQSPIMVGVGGCILEEQKDWINWLNQQAIHSLLLVTPQYAKPCRKGQTRWFEALLDEAESPCILYNVPGRSAVSMAVDTVSDLLEHPNFYGIKEASGSVVQFKEYHAAAKGKMMFCGDDGLMPEFTAAGARGLISVASNVWPEETYHYVRLNLSGQFIDSGLWKKATSSLFAVSNPIPVKALMKDLQVISCDHLQAPLERDDLESLDQQIKFHHEITQWNQQQTDYLI